MRVRSLLFWGVVLAVAPAGFAGRVIADETDFGVPVGADALSEERAGDETTNTESFNTGVAASSTQTVTSESSSNTIGGDAPAGSITVSGDVMQNLGGIGNFVVNTGPQSSVAGIVNLTVSLNQTQ
jgi:hypothetical protein